MAPQLRPSERGGRTVRDQRRQGRSGQRRMDCQQAADAPVDAAVTPNAKIVGYRRLDRVDGRVDLKLDCAPGPAAGAAGRSGNAQTR